MQTKTLKLPSGRSVRLRIPTFEDAAAFDDKEIALLNAGDRDTILKMFRHMVVDKGFDPHKLGRADFARLFQEIALLQLDLVRAMVGATLDIPGSEELH